MTNITAPLQTSVTLSLHSLSSLTQNYPCTYSRPAPNQPTIAQEHISELNWSHFKFGIINLPWALSTAWQSHTCLFTFSFCIVYSHFKPTPPSLPKPLTLTHDHIYTFHEKQKQIVSTPLYSHPQIHHLPPVPRHILCLPWFMILGPLTFSDLPLFSPISLESSISSLLSGHLINQVINNKNFPSTTFLDPTSLYPYKAKPSQSHVYCHHTSHFLPNHSDCPHSSRDGAHEDCQWIQHFWHTWPQHNWSTVFT